MKKIKLLEPWRNKKKGDVISVNKFKFNNLVTKKIAEPIETKPQFAPLREIWRDDYYSICSQLKHHIETSADGFIHTSNGTHIQVRSKDSKPYHPIFSSVYGRAVSNKNHAFYFQKQFVYDIQKMNSESV